ncbi:MAG: GFA family protein [Myxococcales bacterium]
MSTARPELPATFEGGCHCGNVRFRVTLRSWRMSECNCSICTKKGFLHLITAKEDFELLGDPNALTNYTFNTGTARHLFCSTCGVHSYYVPRSHPDGFSVNARCLSGVEASWFERVNFDGKNWETQIKDYA